VFTPSSPAPRNSIARQRRSGFSLVEVVLAVGVISFAFVAILGLLPAGLTQFRQAMDNSVASQIAQRILMDAQQSDFDVLIDSAHNNPGSVTPIRARTFSASDTAKSTPLYVRYFDEQGNEIVPQGMFPTAKEAVAIVYHVNTRITPGTSLPGSSPTGNADLGSTGVNVSLATVLVQVAFNPSGKQLAIDSNLMFNTTVEKGLSVRNYSAQIGRND